MGIQDSLNIFVIISQKLYQVILLKDGINSVIILIQEKEEMN